MGKKEELIEYLIANKDIKQLEKEISELDGIMEDLDRMIEKSTSKAVADMLAGTYNKAALRRAELNLKKINLERNAASLELAWLLED